MDTIHILQKTYENLYVARIPLLNYLSSRLPVISSTWKRDCVERVLNEGVQKNFSELDIYYLIQILTDQQNIDEILSVFPEDNLIYEDNFELFKKIKELRCNVMHPSFAVYTYEDFSRWNTDIESFVRIFSPEKNLDLLTAEFHQSEKEQLLNFIIDKVIDPALTSSKLSSEFKEHIKNTKDRLEKQNTADGIMAFFNDALIALNGKEIAKTLEANGLLSFEKIRDEVEKIYYQ